MDSAVCRFYPVADTFVFHQPLSTCKSKLAKNKQWMYSLSICSLLYNCGFIYFHYRNNMLCLQDTPLKKERILKHVGCGPGTSVVVSISWQSWTYEYYIFVVMLIFIYMLISHHFGIYISSIIRAIKVPQGGIFSICSIYLGCGLTLLVQPYLNIFY